MHDIKIKTNSMMRLSCFVDGNELHNVRAIDFHTSIDEIPTFEIELVGNPDMSVFGNACFSFSSKTVTEAVTILRNELLEHGEIYNGFAASIAAALNSRMEYASQATLPFEPLLAAAEDILDFIIGKEE